MVGARSVVACGMWLHGCGDFFLRDAGEKLEIRSERFGLCYVWQRRTLYILAIVSSCS
jgi:hypothetical protein